jgi:hypothetical protein
LTDDNVRLFIECLRNTNEYKFAKQKQV